MKEELTDFIEECDKYALVDLYFVVYGKKYMEDEVIDNE